MMHLRFAVSVVRTLVDETNARRRSCCVVFQAIWYSFQLHRNEQSVFIAGTPRMLYVLFPLSGLACARTSGIFTVSGANRRGGVNRRLPNLYCHSITH